MCKTFIRPIRNTAKLSYHQVHSYYMNSYKGKLNSQIKRLIVQIRQIETNPAKVFEEIKVYLIGW
jgi:hypothetical protein